MPEESVSTLVPPLLLEFDEELPEPGVGVPSVDGLTPVFVSGDAVDAPEPLPSAALRPRPPAVSPPPMREPSTIAEIGLKAVPLMPDSTAELASPSMAPAPVSPAI